MQNDHEELWNLIDLVRPGHLGDWKSFKEDISQPILFGRYIQLTPCIYAGIVYSYMVVYIYCVIEQDENGRG